MVATPIPQAPDIGAIGSMMGNVIVLLIALLAVAFVVGVVLARRRGMWIFKKWNLKVIVFERRGEYLIPTEDRARLIADKTGKRLYEFKSSNDKIPALAFKNILPGNILPIYSPNRGEYHPLTFNEMEHKVEVINPATGVKENITEKGVDIEPIMNEGQQLAYAQEVLNTYQRFHIQGFFEKYGGLLTILAVGLVIVLMLYVSVQQITAIYGAASGQVTAMSNACQAIAVAKVAASNSTAAIPPG